MPTPKFAELAIGLMVVFLVRFILIGGLATLWTRTSQWARRRRVYRRDLAPGQISSELRSTAKVMVVDAVIAAGVLSTGVIRFHDENALPRALGTFVALFAWFEVWFYVVHRALHHPRLFFLHRQHHVARVTDPFAAMSFDLIERATLQLGILGFAALVSQWVPLARGGLAVYLLSNFILNVLAHSNVEFMPAAFPRTFLGRFFISSSFHAMHHARMQGHYGLFTQVMDKLGGTFFDDYPLLHERAARGEGAQKLGERVSDDPKEAARPEASAAA